MDEARLLLGQGYMVCALGADEVSIVPEKMTGGQSSGAIQMNYATPNGSQGKTQRLGVGNQFCPKNSLPEI